MKKGCIIALVVCLVLAVLAGIGIFIAGKKGMGFVNSGVLYAIEEAANNYAKENPENLPTDNAGWATALKGTDYDGDIEGQDMEIDDFINGGVFKTPTQTQEAVFTVNDDKSVTVVFPGKDKKAGTADDVTSESMRKILQKGK